MKKQFERKYRWHLMAWGMAISYLLLHHALAQASYDASVREFSKPVIVAEPQQPVLSKAAPHSYFHPAPLLRGGELLGVNISEGDCHTVTLLVDVFSSPSFGSESGERPLSTTLCHLSF